MFIFHKTPDDIHIPYIAPKHTSYFLPIFTSPICFLGEIKLNRSCVVNILVPSPSRIIPPSPNVLKKTLRFFGFSPLAHPHIYIYPRIGVPLNHPFYFRMFHSKPSIFWGTSIYGNAHISYPLGNVYITMENHHS